MLTIVKIPNFYSIKKPILNLWERKGKRGRGEGGKEEGGKGEESIKETACFTCDSVLITTH